MPSEKVLFGIIFDVRSFLCVYGTYLNANSYYLCIFFILYVYGHNNYVEHTQG